MSSWFITQEERLINMDHIESIECYACVWQMDDNVRVTATVRLLTSGNDDIALFEEEDFIQSPQNPLNEQDEEELGEQMRREMMTVLLELIDEDLIGSSAFSDRFYEQLNELQSQMLLR